MSTDENESTAAGGNESDEEKGGIIPFAGNDARPVYANHVQLQITPWDFTFRFGIIGVRDGEIAATEEARVLVSPQHLKAISRLIERQIARYEERYGPIPDIGKEEVVLEIDVPA